MGVDDEARSVRISWSTNQREIQKDIKRFIVHWHPSISAQHELEVPVRGNRVDYAVTTEQLERGTFYHFQVTVVSSNLTKAESDWLPVQLPSRHLRNLKANYESEDEEKAIVISSTTD